VRFLTGTRFATPGTSVEGQSIERGGQSSYLALDDSKRAKQRVASDRLCDRFGELLGAIVQQRRR